MVQLKLKIRSLIRTDIIIMVICWLVCSCANVGMPSGGQKDTEPPKVLISNPPDQSTYFEGQVIKITFNEYIQLKNINQQLIISPPLKDKPEIKLKSKTLVVDLNNPLHDSTTYSVFFGDAIADNNEGNILKNFRYAFSTGDQIDSLRAGGTLLNAFTLKPEKDILIMLYADKNDSAPLMDMPMYVCRTGEKGEFLITNIRKNSYKIFALKDADGNFRYDQQGESVAFSDSLIIPDVISSFTYDTTVTKTDTLKTDSVSKREVAIFSPLDIKLLLFDEPVKKLFMKKPDRPEKNRCNFYFSQSLSGIPEIVPLNFQPGNDWYVCELNTSSDTVICWITDTTIAKLDTLKLKINYHKTGGSGSIEQASDTSKLGFRPKPLKNNEKPKAIVLDPGCNVKRAKLLDQNQNIVFNFSAPLSSFSNDKISFFRYEDSIKNPEDFRFYKDSLMLRRYYISADWTENTRYSMFIPPGTFMDISGVVNDTIKADFTIQKTDYYGSIIIKISKAGTRGIIQLLNNKDIVIREKNINGSGTEKFEYLNPGNYRLKYIFDRNSNKKWDTGNYLQKIQPEKVLMYKEDIKVRSNWDVEINWEVR